MFLSALGASLCSAEELKEGWNKLALSTMTSGCTYAIITPQVAAVREKTGYTGNGIPPEFEAVFKEVTKKVEVMCGCVSVHIAEKWTYKEAKSKENSPEMNDYIKN